MSALRVHAGLVVLLLMSCSQEGGVGRQGEQAPTEEAPLPADEVPASTPAEPAPAVIVEAPQPVPVTMHGLGEGALRGYGPGELEPFTRPRRRMDIDQLSAAIRHATGGLGWTEQRGGQEVDLFEELAPTLGRPDYVEITREVLEPTTLFQKFLGDAARSVCRRLVEREAAGGGGVAPSLMVHVGPEDSYETNPAGVDANLRSLLLRYHGRSVAADAPELDDWRWLLTSINHVLGEPRLAWETLCVALITHPDFYTY